MTAMNINNPKIFPWKFSAWNSGHWIVHRSQTWFGSQCKRDGSLTVCFNFDTAKRKLVKRQDTIRKMGPTVSNPVRNFSPNVRPASWIRCAISNIFTKCWGKNKEAYAQMTPNTEDDQNTPRKHNRITNCQYLWHSASQSEFNGAENYLHK